MEMPPEELNSRIAQLEDGDAIRELTARYAFHVAGAEPSAVVQLFTDDGIFESSGIVRQGTAALLAFYAQQAALEPEHTIPFVANHVIDLRGDDAKGTCSMLTPWQHRGEGFCGFYEDTYRREASSWRFSHRKWSYHRRPGPHDAGPANHRAARPDTGTP